MKRCVFLVPLLILNSSCTSEVNIETTSSKVEITSTCSFLLESLKQDQKIISDQDQLLSKSNTRIAIDDPAFAEALSDYPFLNYSIMKGDNWDQHALRMISMYSKASNMVSENAKFSSTLKDSGFVWSKRLVSYRTPNGPNKLKISMEQISLDTREANVNRPIISKICNFSNTVL